MSLGEQVARAYAPTGGVVCVPSDQPVPPPTPRPQGMKPPGLAYTTMAYQTIPMFWTGTAMLLVGVVLVAAVPGTMARPRIYAPVGGVRPVGLPPASPPPPAEDVSDSGEAQAVAEPETETDESTVEDGEAESETAADSTTETEQEPAEAQPEAESQAEPEIEPADEDEPVADAEAADGAEATAKPKPKLPLMPRRRPKN